MSKHREREALLRVNIEILRDEVKTLTKIEKMMDELLNRGSAYKSLIELFDEILEEQGANTCKLVEQLQVINPKGSQVLTKALMLYKEFGEVDSDKELAERIRQTKLRKELEIEEYSEEIMSGYLEESRYNDFTKKG